MSIVGNSDSQNISSRSKHNEKNSRHRKWSQEAMQRAYEDCMQRGLPCRTSSKKHGVPRTTLRDRLTLRVKPNCRQGRTTHLSDEQEKYLVDYITFMSLQGFSVTVQQVINEAWGLDQNSRNAFGQNGPSSNWWFRFHQRHPEVRNILSYPNIKDKTFLGLVNNLRAYFQHLKAVLEKGSFLNRPQDIYYCDEVIVDQTKLSKQVLIPRRMLYFHQVNSSEHFSIQCCVSAAGRAMPPFITFKPPISCNSTIGVCPDGAVFNCYNDGLLNPDLFLRWLQQVFVPMALPRPDKPVLLLLDGHRTQCSIKVVEEAVKSNIILMAAAPASSPLCQPLDIVIYKSLKLQLEALMILGRSSQGNLWITTNDVPKIVKAFANSISVESDIQEGFKLCGIFPLNPNAVDKTQLGHNKMKIEEDVDLSVAPQMHVTGRATTMMHHEIRTDSSRTGTLELSKNSASSLDKPTVVLIEASGGNQSTEQSYKSLFTKLDSSNTAARDGFPVDMAKIGEQSSRSLATKHDTPNTAARDGYPVNVAQIGEQSYRSLATKHDTPNTAARDGSPVNVAQIGEQLYMSLATKHDTSNTAAKDGSPVNVAQIGEQSYRSLAIKHDTSNTAARNGSPVDVAQIREQSYRSLPTKRAVSNTAQQDSTPVEEVKVEIASRRTTSLSLEKEKYLCDYVMFLASKGFTVSSNHLIANACSVDQKSRLEMFGKKGLTEFWLKKLINQHSEIKRLLSRHNLKKCETLFGAIDSIRGYFQSLQSVLVMGKLLSRPQDIYYCDEVVVNPHKSADPIMIPRRQLPSNKVTSREHFSIQCCVSAAGRAMPPLFTFKSTVPSEDCTNDRPNSVAYDCQEFVNPELFLKWFQRVFVPLSKPGIDKPVLLLLDGKGSQCSPELLEDAAKNNVIVVAAAPQPISLQPLDVLAYKFLKLRLENLANVVLTNAEALWISKNDVPRNITSCVESIMSVYNVKEGFKQCGIYPFNPNAVSTDQLPGIKLMPIGDELLNLCAPPLDNCLPKQRYASKLFWDGTYNEEACVPLQCKSSTRPDGIKTFSSDQRSCNSVGENVSTSIYGHPCVKRHRSSNLGNHLSASASVHAAAVEGPKHCRSTTVNAGLTPEPVSFNIHTNRRSITPFDISEIQNCECSGREDPIKVRLESIPKSVSLCALPHRVVPIHGHKSQSGTKSRRVSKRPQPEPTDARRGKRAPDDLDKKSCSLPTRPNCFDDGDGDGSCTCFKCHKKWDDEPAALQSRWKKCQSMNCNNLICPRCLPPGFDYEREHYYCINSAMVKVEM